jgi:hypothetical protein
MKRGLINSIACAGLLMFTWAAGPAAAQTHNGDDNWYRTREGYFTGNNWKMRLFERVRVDLDHIQTVAFAGADEYRIMRTKEQVGELQTKLADGKYDQPELDEVISGLERVVADNRLTARDRDILNDDLSRVRDYRAHHEDWR